MSLYGGNAGEGFDKLRYRRFVEKLVTNTSSVRVHILPPLAAAAQYHNIAVCITIFFV